MPSNTAWGIEVGASAIKAIRLTREGDAVRVSDFAYIPHKKVLSTPDLDQNEMIRLGLGQFISQKAVEGETLVMSVPGHAAFARFAKLPPVEVKKVPDIVKFEAVQQIPFPIEEVEWDYQTFMADDSPEIEVGIFAITRERVQQRLALYAELGITPEALNLSPVAVYNAMAFDHELEKRQMAVIYLDIGTNATDVIVANQGQCWIRTFPLGGTHFTEAIANAFKLSYSKAEKLKQEAATSKYAKQIMQAMRPVFTDLLQDVQRSLGYYQSVHRDVELKTMVGLGSTFKIPGLRKFLGQQLQMDVVRLDEYRRIRVEGREAASFSETAVNIATAYGLALQGVGLAKIDVNLVPVKVLRETLWHGKIKWFAAAAALAIVAGSITFIKPLNEQRQLPGDGPRIAQDVIRDGTQVASQFESVVQRHNGIGHKAENVRRLLDYRTVWPFVINDVAHALGAASPQDELLGDDLDQLMALSPSDRNLVELLHLDSEYYFDPESDDKSRQIEVRMRVFLTHENPTEFLNQTVAKWLRDHAEPTGDRANVPYRILTDGGIGVRVDFENMVVAETPTATEEADTSRGQRARQNQQSRRDDRRTGQQNQGNQTQGGGDEGGDMSGAGIGEQETGRSGYGRGGNRTGGPGNLRPGGGDAGQGSGGSGGTIRDPRTPPGGNRGGGGGLPELPSGGNESGQTDLTVEQLNQLAPAPPRPRLLPPNTRYYETDIVFTVELLDPTFDPRGDRSANAADDTQEAGS